MNVVRWLAVLIGAAAPSVAAAQPVWQRVYLRIELADAAQLALRLNDLNAEAKFRATFASAVNDSLKFWDVQPTDRADATPLLTARFFEEQPGNTARSRQLKLEVTLTPDIPLFEGVIVPQGEYADVLFDRERVAGVAGRAARVFRPEGACEKELRKQLPVAYGISLLGPGASQIVVPLRMQRIAPFSASRFEVQVAAIRLDFLGCEEPNAGLLVLQTDKLPPAPEVTQFKSIWLKERARHASRSADENTAPPRAAGGTP